jgi:hypothetical protein
MLNIQFQKKKNFFFILNLSLFFLLINFFKFDDLYYNFDWNFAHLTSFFLKENNYFDIRTFKIWQANSSFYSVLIYLIKSFVNLLNIEISILNLSRLFNIILLIIFSFKFLKVKFLDNFEKRLLLIFLFFLPITNVYYFRSYPDAAALIIFFFSLIFYLEKNFTFFLFTFILCCLLKPICFIFFFIFPLIELNFYKNFYYKDYKKLSKKFFIIFFVTLVSLIVYLFYIFTFENDIFLGSIKKTYINFEIKNSVMNFINYINYSMTLTLPIYLFLIYLIYKERNFNKIIKILILTFIIYVISKIFTLSLHNVGEMNFGYISQSIKNFNFYFYNLLFFFNIFFLIFIFFDNNKSKNYIIIFLLLTIVLSFIIYRPAQRYLLYVLPFLILSLAQMLKNYEKDIRSIVEKSILYFILIFFSAINIGQALVQKKKYQINNEFYREIVASKLINKVHPGSIEHSHGIYFENYLMNKNELFDYSKFIYIIKDKGCVNLAINMPKVQTTIYKYINYELCLIKQS